jgi:hypothetical protein
MIETTDFRGVRGTCAVPELPSENLVPDVRTIGRAIRERWPIPAAIRKDIPEMLGAIVAGSEDERAKVAAAKVLVMMDKLNLDNEKRGDPSKRETLPPPPPPVQQFFSITAENLTVNPRELSDDDLQRQIAELSRRVPAEAGGTAPPAGAGPPPADGVPENRLGDGGTGSLPDLELAP